MKPATDRQREVLALVFERMTMREIGEVLGIGSTNAVAQHMDLMEAKGLVVKPKHGKRTPWTLTDAGLTELGLRRCEHCGGAGVRGTYFKVR